MAIFLSTDWHLGHSKIIEYDRRPYKSTDEMDAHIINITNEVVTEKDLLVYGGDFAMPQAQGPG